MSRPIDPDLRHSNHGPAREPVSALEPGAQPLGDPDPNEPWLWENGIVAVAWNPDGDGPGTSLSGTITTSAPLCGNYTAFNMEGVFFAVTSCALGEQFLGFAYQGPKSVAFIKGLVVPDRTIVLS